MEVRGISQGGQTTIGSTSNFDVMAQVNKQDVGTTVDNKETAKENVKVKDVKNAVDKLNKFLEDNKSHAEYEVHEKLKDIMIKIVDDKTGQVIQEIPPKKILDMVAKMMEMVGVLFDKKA